MVFATPFAVFWQESDLAAFPSDYASSLAAVIDATLETMLRL
jgi:hypothetical protein